MNDPKSASPVRASRRALPVRGAAFAFTLLMGLASVYPSLWSIPEAPAGRPPVAGLRAPEMSHREGSCRCIRCAGPSVCPCDHGTGSRGAVCGSSNDDRPLKAQDAAPLIPSKVMCEVPHQPPTTEVWTRRFEAAEVPPGSPLSKAVDKVPISPL